MDTDEETAIFLDQMKNANPHRKHHSSTLGKQNVSSFFKKYEPPTANEGFASIHHVNLIIKYVNEEEETLYNLIH